MTLYRRAGLYILCRSVDDARLYDPAADRLGPSLPLAAIVGEHAREWLPVMPSQDIPGGLRKYLLLPFPGA